MADVALGSDSANITAINVVDQGSDPAAPGSGHVLLYVKGGVLYARGNVGSPAAIGASPALTQNRLGVGDGSNLLSALAAGTAGQLLQSNGASAPTWEDPPEAGGGGSSGPLLFFPHMNSSRVGNALGFASATGVWGSYYFYQNIAAQNDSLVFPCWLDAGTYTLGCLHVKGTTYAIATFYLDATNVGTIDAYGGSATYNNVGTITGIVVATAGAHNLSWVIETRNGSSGGWNFAAQYLWLHRTA